MWVKVGAPEEPLSDRLLGSTHSWYRLLALLDYQWHIPTYRLVVLR
jgi:hypothetical protein